MIEDDAQLAQRQHVLDAIERSLAALRRRVEPVNPALFTAMAGNYISDILRIRSEIDAYVGTSQVMDSRAPFWLALEGRGLTASEVSSRLLADWLDRLRRSVQGVARVLQTGPTSLGRRPSDDLLAATDFRLVALAEGSIRIGLKLPDSFIQGELFASEQEHLSPVRIALDHLLEMALWAESNSIDPPLATFPDRTQAAAIAARLAELVPSVRSGVTSVSFEGVIVPSPTRIRLTPAAKEKLEGLVKLLEVLHEDIITGTIREIDLDQKRMIVRERGPNLPDIKCYIPEELMVKVQSLLDVLVDVRGIMSASSPFEMHVTEVSKRS